MVSVKEINNIEAFYLPNLFNTKICSFIKYGKHNIGKVLVKSTHDFYTDSVLK